MFPQQILSWCEVQWALVAAPALDKEGQTFHPTFLVNEGQKGKFYYISDI